MFFEIYIFSSRRNDEWPYGYLSIEHLFGSILYPHVSTSLGEGKENKKEEKSEK